MPVTELFGNASIANTALVQMVEDAWIQLRLDEAALAGPMWLWVMTVLEKTLLIYLIISLNI